MRYGWLDVGRRVQSEDFGGLNSVMGGWQNVVRGGELEGKGQD